MIRTQLEIPVLLPDAPDRHDRCVDRLVAGLEAKEGIENVHVREAEGDQGDRLCIHYDASILPLARVRELARALGGTLTEEYGHVLLPMEDARSQRKAGRIAQQMRGLPGVLEAVANATGPLRLEFERSKTDEETLRSRLTSFGVHPHDSDSAESDHHAEEHHHYPLKPSGRFKGGSSMARDVPCRGSRSISKGRGSARGAGPSLRVRGSA